MKTALILGVTGQTGAYLSGQLLTNGYRVVGSSRDWSESNTWRLKKRGVLESVEGVSLSLHDHTSLARLLDSVAPDEIYYLAGPSSVAASFREPTVSMSDIFDPVVNILELLKQRSSNATFVNAASTDCFGDQSGTILNETSRMQPISPYGISKTATFWATQNYRKAFDIRARNAILTNHESPLRGAAFVTQKIISGLRDITLGKKKSIALGNTTIGRDWLWADDVARALALIGSSPQSHDCVVASGTTSTLDEFTTLACAEFELDPNVVLTHDPALTRPREIQSVHLDPSRIKDYLGWQPQVSFPELVSRLVRGEP